VPLRGALRGADVLHGAGVRCGVRCYGTRCGPDGNRRFPKNPLPLLAPADAGRFPAHPGGDTLLEQPTSGFFIQDARQVTLRNCEVVWHPEGERPAEFRHAVEAHHVDNLSIENFKGESARPDTYPAIKKS